jgi:hypothetical protein
VNPLHVGLLAVLLLLHSDHRLLLPRELVVVGMVKFIHLVGYPVRIVPDERLRLVELSAF